MYIIYKHDIDQHRTSKNWRIFVPLIMRQLTAILLALIITSQAFYNVGVLAYWLANRAYIAATLCENKDKPQLHCNGKCYLKKKIAETPDSAPVKGLPKAPSLKKGIEVADYLPQVPVLVLKDSPTTTTILIPGGQHLHPALLVDGIFRPPASMPV